MRQAGILAAAGLVALSDGPDGMIERLAEDHANARRLAEALSGMDGIVSAGGTAQPGTGPLDPGRVRTNFVLFRVERDRAAVPRGAPSTRCRDGGISARTGARRDPLRRDGHGHRNDHRRRPRGPRRDQPATLGSDRRRLRDLTAATAGRAIADPPPEGHRP